MFPAIFCRPWPTVPYTDSCTVTSARIGAKIASWLPPSCEAARYASEQARAVLTIVSQVPKPRGLAVSRPLVRARGGAGPGSYGAAMCEG